MNFKEENGVFSLTQKISIHVVKETDSAVKKAITEYAKKQSKKLGEEVKVLFIDEEKADKIIDLGVKEYLKQKGNE